MEDRRLVHELWDELDEAGGAHTVLLAGPRGDSGRHSLGPNARLRTTFEASSWFEAMTIYYRLMEWGEYKNDPAWDCEPYPEEWVREQREAEGKR